MALRGLKADYMIANRYELYSVVHFCPGDVRLLAVKVKGRVLLIHLYVCSCNICVLLENLTLLTFQMYMCVVLCLVRKFLISWY